MAKHLTEIFPNPFNLNGDTEDPRDYDFRIFGLHQKETFEM